MQASSNFDVRESPRWLGLAAGIRMMAYSGRTVQHLFSAYGPASIQHGSICDVNGFVTGNCVAWSSITGVASGPTGCFRRAHGALGALRATLAGPDLPSANQTLLAANAMGASGCLAACSDMLRRVR